MDIINYEPQFFPSKYSSPSWFSRCMKLYPKLNTKFMRPLEIWISTHGIKLYRLYSVRYLETNDRNLGWIANLELDSPQQNPPVIWNCLPIFVWLSCTASHCSLANYNSPRRNELPILIIIWIRRTNCLQ